MFAKTTRVDKAIQKALKQEYNELNQAHFKSHNDLKVLQNDYDRLMKDYGKMEVINVKQDKTFVGLENTYT